MHFYALPNGFQVLMSSRSTGLLVPTPGPPDQSHHEPTGNQLRNPRTGWKLLGEIDFTYERMCGDEHSRTPADASIQTFILV